MGYRARTPKYPNGTGCYQRSRSPQRRVNWEKWQLCHGCARKLHPEFYKNKKKHGVNKLHGTEMYNEKPFTIEVLPVV